jgi:CheY-like chemotaxis protein
VLGITTYQEALRALGSMLEGGTRVDLKEAPEQACVHLTTESVQREIGAAELQEIVLASRARRGTPQAPQQPTSPTADLLRAVGFALDELYALGVDLELRPDALAVRFRDRNLRPRELTYIAEEMEDLRQAAAQRRKGDPLRRVLILHDDAETIGPLRELLVAEFAVQVLPWLYAPAVVQSGDPPDAILTRAAVDPTAMLEVIRTLRAARRTAGLPILVVGAPASGLDAAAAFAAGADDVLQEPFMPAQLRARLRTCLLRRRGDEQTRRRVDK